MSATPWLGDACSLVDAFRRGDHHPVDELRATLGQIGRSQLNAFSHLDADAAMRIAERADVSLPFGGLPVGIKELDRVEGWPDTEASKLLAGRVAPHDSTSVSRLRAAGSVLVGLTTASEFGFVNVSRSELNGVTHNPWQHGRTAGGSSGGSAAAVAGGLVPIASGGDGGGSIRIPGGFCGLFGFKVTYGRIPKGPDADVSQLTAVPGCLSRSVRDTARWIDVVGGHHPRDPLSLPKAPSYEAGLGAHDMLGLRATVQRDWGNAYVADRVWELVEPAAEQLIADASLRRVDAPLQMPRTSGAWSMSGVPSMWGTFGEFWPDHADAFTVEMRFALEHGPGRYDLAARVEMDVARRAINEAMADVFDATDLVITATNPDIAFDATSPPPSTFGGVEAGPWNNGRLTFPANLYGCPAMSLPIGTVDGLPVGMQVIARHHREDVLLDLALAWERAHPWPLVAPGAPH
jgi:aspartyl-tRNA(Asn)/glutamyl-tRNA(Gln) amidotransferase subunit A